MSRKDITVYMIGNAHIDPVWLWKWQEGFAEVLATCCSALDRMNEYPDFVFTRADAATYKWIEDSCPEMFEEIRARVREGRWSIVGGWWEQPDCNIPSGESFVRHELYGKRYFLDKFGVDVKVGYNADSFGHNAGLPQILSKAGIKYYVFMRPELHEKELPESMFYWQGPDGSSVVCYRIQGPYGTWWEDLGEHVIACADTHLKGTNVIAGFYGVGDHGGGPTINHIESIKRSQADPEAPNAVFGTLERFFEHALSERTDFPIVEGDLQHHSVGCYTSHSDIKMWNRKAENTLVNAEKFCAMAKMAGGRAVPKQPLAQAWQKVLFNQFHDTLAGTSLDVAYDDVQNAMGAAIDTAEYELNAALSGIAWNVDTRGEGEPVVVFNPHAYAVKYVSEYGERLGGLCDHTGRFLPAQTAVPLFESTADRPRKIFVDTLPPFGYRLYYSVEEDTNAQFDSTLSVSESGLESSFYRIDVDSGTGDILQIVDRRTGAAVLASPTGAVVMTDNSDTWSHGVVAFNDRAGRFGEAKVEVVETGPVRATLRIESRFHDSVMWQDLSLYADLPIIECRVTVDWHEKHRLLKFEFPLDLDNPVATYDAAYAIVNAATDGGENPGQKWIDVTGTDKGQTRGVGLINDGKYGFDVEGSTMRMSALRSPVYAFHDPREVEEGNRYHYMDQGMHSFKFALLPHAGAWQDAETVSQALLFNMPPVAVETSCHSGRYPREHSYGAVSAANVDVCVVKEAEEDDSLIVRLYETSGKATQTVLRLGENDYPISIGPFELKTLKIKGTTAVAVDLIERAVT